MRTCIRRSNSGPAARVGAGVGCLLIVILSLPLEAAPPGAKSSRASTVRPTAAIGDEAQGPPPVPASAQAPEEDPPTIDVIQGVRTGKLSYKAEGTGDGKLTLSLTNRTNTRLRVVLPPGLIAAGATGQFGMGMGGMGGGMGGMGGGMGGMGGGMGGMSMGGTMPASMGMMMLGRLIMSLIGDKDSWDQSSLMMGMSMGMGGMGGGMGGMGGMGMGGMRGGGMRSVPPTSRLFAQLKPGQTRHLPTTVVSMNGPDANARPVLPAKGESLQLSPIDLWTEDRRTRAALKRLGEAKAPQTIAQMVLWYVTAGADWDDIGRFAQGWGNAQEIALARQFVAGLKETETSSPRIEPSALYWEMETEGEEARGLADGVRALWSKGPVLGLTAREGVPESPGGPALACRIKLGEAAIDVKLAGSHPSGSDWVAIGSFRIKRSELKTTPDERGGETTAPTTEEPRDREAARLGDAVAEAMLGRLVRIQLSRGPKVKGKDSFRIRIVNESPLILNGLALGGPAEGEDHLPSVLAGLSIPPLKSLTVPASAELIARLHLKDGVHPLAADLSGL